MLTSTGSQGRLQQEVSSCKFVNSYFSGACPIQLLFQRNLAPIYHIKSNVAHTVLPQSSNNRPQPHPMRNNHCSNSPKTFNQCLLLITSFPTAGSSEENLHSYFSIKPHYLCCLQFVTPRPLPFLQDDCVHHLTKWNVFICKFCLWQCLHL